MSLQSPHPGDGGCPGSSRPRPPPNIAARNGATARKDAADKSHELPDNQLGRCRWLEGERESLHRKIQNYACEAGRLCNIAENRGKTVSSISLDNIRPFVRALRQLAMLNKLIGKCKNNNSLLMGDLTRWREHYRRDTNAQDLLGMDSPVRIMKNYANMLSDAAYSIWHRRQPNEWPSIALALRGMVREAAAQN
ncbi:uncharacterized protein BKCO1_1000072 [Diplodia corticola]|uniref:Uncharacterized protein n=1 Tax=Diplodia corticola TaxID=236234 RepID=A0A1J9R7V8_9PEZI|nr:uncharacterized protein BKCO1_1000072 [Diplodia corticola]OJD36680.1 hypothetical protein BKCO1_1000072 [Diplodia corticola]